jgi:hypothetical protein
MTSLKASTPKQSTAGVFLARYSAYEGEGNPIVWGVSDKEVGVESVERVSMNVWNSLRQVG